MVQNPMIQFAITKSTCTSSMRFRWPWRFLSWWSVTLDGLSLDPNRSSLNLPPGKKRKQPRRLGKPRILSWRTRNELEDEGFPSEWKCGLRPQQLSAAGNGSQKVVSGWAQGTSMLYIACNRHPLFYLTYSVIHS